jgi:hypothetical protein
MEPIMEPYPYWAAFTPPAFSLPFVEVVEVWYIASLKL